MSDLTANYAHIFCFNDLCALAWNKTWMFFNLHKDLICRGIRRKVIIIMKYQTNTLLCSTSFWYICLFCWNSPKINYNKITNKSNHILMMLSNKTSNELYHTGRQTNVVTAYKIFIDHGNRLWNCISCCLIEEYLHYPTFLCAPQVRWIKIINLALE